MKTNTPYDIGLELPAADELPSDWVQTTAYGGRLPDGIVSHRIASERWPAIQAELDRHRIPYKYHRIGDDKEYRHNDADWESRSARQGPSPAEIAELKQQGYSVYMVSDQDPAVYGWLHTSGACQREHQHRQPFRSTSQQAWDDCRDYASGDMPTTPNPDWADPKA